MRVHSLGTHKFWAYRPSLLEVSGHHVDWDLRTYVELSLLMVFLLVIDQATMEKVEPHRYNTAQAPVLDKFEKTNSGMSFQKMHLITR